MLGRTLDNSRCLSSIPSIPFLYINQRKNEVKDMKVINKVHCISNYSLDEIQNTLNTFAEDGFSLVNTEIAKNRFGCTVMYLFFTKKVDNEE
jgi:hypothetical protein